MPARHRRRPTTPLWQRAAAVVLYTATCLTVFTVVAIGVGIGAHRLRVEAIESNSMRPVFARGTAVFLTPESFDQVRVGQIISYVPPQPFPQVNVVHRVYAIRRLNANAIEVQTKGDANKAPDPWQTVISGNGVWRLKAAVPYLGQLPLLFGNPMALIGIVLVIASMLVVLLTPAGDSRHEPATPATVTAWQGIPIVPAWQPSLAPPPQAQPQAVPELHVASTPIAPPPIQPTPVPTWDDEPVLDEDTPPSIFSLLGQ